MYMLKCINNISLMRWCGVSLAQVHQLRSKYNNRMKVPLSKPTLTGPTHSEGGSSEEPLPPLMLRRQGSSTPPPYTAEMRRPTWDSVMNSPKSVPIPMPELGEESPIPELPTRNRKLANPNVESVRVFPNLEEVRHVAHHSDNSSMEGNRKTVTIGNPSPSSNASSSIPDSFSQVFLYIELWLDMLGLWSYHQLKRGNVSRL